MVNTAKGFFRKNLDLCLIFLLLFLFPLFFYKLGQSSLVSFDEAWYGSIAKNILKTGNLFLLSFNGQIYSDHPPFGFWLIAISQKILGPSEFAVRLPAALSGLFSLIIVYLLGKELFNRWVGIASAIALSSATWFLFRARSGNLDVILTMLFLLTIYLAIKSSKNIKFLIPFSISFSFLFLTKTIVPLTIIPSLIVIFWNHLSVIPAKAGIQKTEKSHGSRNKYGMTILVSLIFFILITSPWLVFQISYKSDFLTHYLNIGLPGVKAETSYIDNLKLMKEYLHNGIGKWFWLGVFGLFVGLLTRQKRFLILSIFFISFFAPFLTSAKGHIWHLVPLHPIMILAFFGFIYVLLEKFVKQKVVIATLLLLISSFISFNQNMQNWKNFIDIPRFISDEEILSKEASLYPDQLYIDGDFLPAAAFYSEKVIKKTSAPELKPVFESSASALIIVNQWRLDELGINASKYQVIKKDRDKLLLFKKVL